MKSIDEAPPELPHLSPIRCKKCGAEAHLMQRRPNVFTHGLIEVLTYECAACGQETIREVET